MGHKRHLSKIHNSTLLNLLATLASYLTIIFPFLIRCLHYLNSAIITFVLSAASVPTLTFTAKTVAMSILHSKLEYCNFLYYGLSKFQINRLQHIQNALAQAPKFKHITPILKSLHWGKVSERIEYEIISLTYKILNTTQPSYLYDLVSIQPPHSHNTPSSPYVTLIKPSSSLKVTHRSFRHASPHLWNQLPTSLRIPHPNYSSTSQQLLFQHAGLTFYTLLSPSITFSLFHSELKTYLFRKSYPSP